MHAHESGPADYPLGKVADGEPPGEWLVFGQNPFNLAGQITNEGPSGEKFRSLVNHLQNPDTGEQLGRAPISNSESIEDKIEDRVKRWRRKNKLATPEQEAAYRIKTAADTRTGVNGWDAAFSAPKSWSVLWAALTWAGRHDEAEKLWLALEAGVRAAMEQLFEELSFTRHGTAGPEQAEGSVTTDYRHAANLIAATFRHHVSRERDPAMHVHVMILNRMLTESGAWHALYSGALLRSKVQLDATFQRVAEAEARRTLGLPFVRNPETPWREIEGVSTDVRDYFSSRHRALTDVAEEKAHEFELRYGVKPNARRRWQMRQQANLHTRKAKPTDAPSREDDVERWVEATEKAAVTHFEDVLGTVDAIVALAAEEEPPEYDEDTVIAQGIADLEVESAVFNYARLSHAISQRLPDHLDTESAEIRALVTRLTDRAIESRLVVSTKGTPLVEVPASMRDKATARSRFDAPDTWKFTTPDTLVAERSLLVRLDHRAAPPVPADTARDLLGRTRLYPEQSDAAFGVLTSDRSLEVLVAGAGTGKSVTVTAISDVAEQVFGAGVTGFTLSESAAMVLRREGLSRAHNIDRFVRFAERADRGAVSDAERVQFAVPRGGIVVIDEASMVDTPLLTKLLARLDDAGVAKVVLVGDTAQVDAVGPGGAFSMLVREAERRDKEVLRGLPTAADFAAADVAAWTGEREPVRVHRLEQVRRFTNPWERVASQGLRDGKPEAVAQYHARGRISGDQNHDRVRDQTAKDFVRDWLEGDSVIVTGTQEEADDLSSRARKLLVEVGHVSAEGVPVRGHNTAGVGDVVQSRLNDHQAEVLNRDRWQVVGTTSEGALHVRQLLGPNEYADEVRVLEPAYVRRQVELGYAGTTHAVEGVTVKGGTSHELVSRMTNAAHAYVGGSRGTEANYWHVELEDNETPAGRLAAIFADDSRTKSAHDEIADAQLREKSLGHLFVLWETAVREARAVTHRDMLIAELGDDAERVLSDPSSNRLFGLLRQAEISGHNPHALVSAVMDKRRVQQNPLSAVESPASLLFARVSDEMKVAGMGEPTPASFEARVPVPRRGEVETEDQVAARLIGRVIDDRKTELALEAAVEAPEWAVRAAGAVPAEPVERDVWMRRVENAAALREAQGFTDQRDAIGRRPSHVEPERVWLWDRAATDLGMPEHERNLQALSPGELANRVQNWERAQAWAPRNVDADLREAHMEWADTRQRMVFARAEGRDTLELESEALACEEDVRRLERVAEVRAEWLERHVGLQHRAEDALLEQERRAELDAARDGAPLPAEPDAEFDEPEADPEAAREDAEFEAHAQVFALWSSHREVDVPEVFSREWFALEPDDPRREAAVVAAAVGGFFSDVDRGELLDRLQSAREVSGEPDVDPEVDVDVLAGVHDWLSPHMTGDAPAFGSAEWSVLEPDDPRRDASLARAAVDAWGMGEPDEQLQARVEAAELRASSIGVAEELKAQREADRQHRVHDERVARVAEEQRERTAWLLPTKVDPEERSADGLAAAALAARFDPEVPETWPAAREPVVIEPTEREMGRLYLESQGVEVEPEPAAEEVVEWPEVAPIPEPKEVAPSATRAMSEGSPIEAEQAPAVPEDAKEEAQPSAMPDNRVTQLPATDDGLRRPAVEAEPHAEREPILPEPDLTPVVDEPDAEEEARFREGLAWSKEQARLQREADDREAAERAEAERREVEAREQRDAEHEAVEADGSRVARSARFQADLEQAERAAELMREREAEQEAAPPEPEPQVEIEAELVD